MQNRLKLKTAAAQLKAAEKAAGIETPPRPILRAGVKYQLPDGTHVYKSR